MADILQTKPQNWKYVSEGGATIVFSYGGSTHPEFDGTVLRLRKSSTSAKKSDDAKALQEAGFNAEDSEPDDPMIEYQTKCIERLIPPQHLPRLQSVQLDKSWLQQLVELHDPDRPQNRREKDGVDLNRKKGVLATDLVGGNWLAIEIKPKWGFLPSPTHLSEETKAVKTKTCRFCMHSHLRVQKGEQVASDYCPLDLFSNDEARVKKAIYSLWNGWVASDATANNLKVFARGKFVKPSEARLILKENIDGTDLPTIRDTFAVALSRPLLETPVLRIISDLQRDLDALDIEGLSKLWKLAESSSPRYWTAAEANSNAPTFTPIGGDSPFIEITEPNISDWVRFLDFYLLPDKPTPNLLNPSPEDLRQYLMSSLLSATFKDCSLIIKLPFLDILNPQVLSENSVTVIDLDPKKMAKLRGWEKLDQEIARSYLQFAQQKRVCVDERQTRK